MNAPMRFFACVLVCAVAAIAACSSSSATTATTNADAGVDAGAESSIASRGVELLSVLDLPRRASTQSLSAAYWDDGTHTLHALQDKTPSIVPLAIDEGYESVTVGTPLALSGRDVDAAWDGEGIARIGDELFVVTNETEPTVERFGLDGKRIAAVAVPASFYADQPGGNKGIESLAASPDARFLFLANEANTPIATKTKGTTINILRRELATNDDRTKRYTTEPLGEGGTTGDMGVSDISALSDHVLLVLERGYQPDYGNTVRIFRVDFDEDADVLTKTLVVDVGALPSDGITHPSTQPNPILDNYEALALGPTRDDGRITLFVASDDNGSASQVARILVLAIPNE